MTGWNNLPTELRWQIIDEIRVLELHLPLKKNRLHLVSRDWNYYFGHDPFRTLVLDQDRLDVFDKIINQNRERRAYVKNILLQVRLPEYGCDKCQSAEDAIMSKTNDLLFLNVLQRLMAMLSTWKREVEPPGPGPASASVPAPPNHTMGLTCSDKGVTLDLGAYSPSDGQHAIRDCRFSEKYQYDAPEVVYKQHADSLRKPKADADAVGTGNNDACPGWARTRAGNAPFVGTQRRLLAAIGDTSRRHYKDVFEFEVEGRERKVVREMISFTAAPVIDALYIRRHFYRLISPVLLARLIETGLPRLRDFRHESWLHLDARRRTLFTSEFTKVTHALPLLSLRSADSLEAVYLCHERPRWKKGQMAASWPFLGGAELGQTVTRLTTRLCCLSAPLVIDAEDFFECARLENLHFPRLECLTLTSHNACYSYRTVNMLTGAAHTVLRRMPKLRFMEIWNGVEASGEVFEFKFSYSRTWQPRIDWCSTWHPHGGLFDVFQEWRRVLQQEHTGKELIVNRYKPKKEVLHMSMATRCFKFKEWGLHPESMKQIEMEERFPIYKKG